MKTSESVLRDLLAGAPLVRTAAPFALVQVHGADAVDFLQRLCSQDVAGLAPGGLAPAAFLTGKGKLVATSLVGRLEVDGEPGLLLEVQAHQRDTLLELLDRYHFTEQLAFGALPSVCREQVVAAEADAEWRLRRDGDVTELVLARHGIGFRRWHAADEAALPAVDGAPLDDDHAECLRMAAGFVKVGFESEANTLALEADLDDHCSTRKGCYTGQEVVARIHTYGHTNRALCLLQLPGGAPIESPVVLVEPEDELQVGRIMRAVPMPGGGRLGVGYLPADFQAVGTELRLEDGAVVTVVG